MGGIVSAPVPKKLLQMAGIEDCYTSARGSTGTLGNFAKATYAAVAATYAYLTPDLWKETIFQKSPYQEFTDWLQKNHKTVGVQRQEVTVPVFGLLGQLLDLQTLLFHRRFGHRFDQKPRRSLFVK